MTTIVGIVSIVSIVAIMFVGMRRARQEWRDR